MKNKKKLVLLIALCLVMIAGLITGAAFAWDNYKKETKRREKAVKAEITEVFHDQGGIYMSPSAPGKTDDVTVRLRCDKYNITKAQVQITKDKGTTWTCIEMTSDGGEDTGYYELWKGTIPAQSEPYWYRFAVANDAQATIYYGCEGLKSYQPDINEMFYVIPGFNTPKWSQGTLWYYAHISQFCNGDTSNDLYREYLMKDAAFGNDYQTMTRGSGDIKGVKDKLDYIQSLGVKSLALGPYFSSSEMFGFGIDNMAAVETAYGNETLLKELITDVHDRNMKVTTDMILSYTVNYSKYFNEYAYFPTSGGYQSKDSQYYEMFRFPKWPSNAVKIWSSIGLDVANDKAAEKIYKNSDSMVLKYLNEPYGLDGYRFDAEESVGNLGYNYEPKEMWQKVTKSIKDVSKDKLILSENPDGIGDQYNTLFDSSWQKRGYFAMNEWFVGSKPGTEMLKVLQDNLINTARPRALSSYNFIGQHDVVRMFDNVETQKNSIQALLLLQMTYLGSPVIYFGDEIGMTNGAYDDQVGQGFNWDESQWDYKILNLVKSLGKLRENYSCLQDGVICQGEVNDPELFLSFGRFDDNGAVITLCNKQDVNQQQEIKVSRYNISDGDILTDYLTGKTYEVKNGKVTVDIIPGGTLLVTGEDRSEYCEEYQITDIGEEIDVLQKEQKTFEIEGEGKLQRDADEIGLLAAKLYNNVSLTSTVQGDAEAVLMLRNNLKNDSAFYGAVYDGKSLTVKARTRKGAEVKEIATAKVSKGSQIKISRTDGNRFVIQYRDGADGGWINIEHSMTTIRMNEGIYAGVTSLDGTAVFENVTIKEEENEICDDFNGEELASMFTASDEQSVPKDGSLKLTSSGDKLSYVKANAHTSDWTFKTEMSSLQDTKDTSFAGVMCEESQDDRVIFARAKMDGKDVLVLAKMLQGKLQINKMTEDKKPQEKVILQLQRIGSNYTAVASYDGKKWFSVGDGLYCNYSKMHAGVCTYNAEADFEYACFGDSINDGISVNTPITLGRIDTGYNLELRNIEGDKMTFLGSEDNWSDIGAGYAKSGSDDISLMYLENKLFNNVKAEATFKITDGSGSTGILVGKQKYTQDTDECYKIGFDSFKRLFISKNGKELASSTVELEDGYLRLIVKKEDGYIHVMTGNSGKPVLSVYDDTYKEGYIAYYAEQTAVEIINYDVTSLKAYWSSNRTVMGVNDSLEMLEQNSISSLERVGITKGVVSFSVRTEIPEEVEDTNRVGVLLGASFAKMGAYGGVSILYDYKKGILTATEGEEELAKKVIAKPDEKPEIDIKVEFANGLYKIFVDNAKAPLMTVKTEKPNGGGVSFYSSNYTTYFEKIVVYDTTNGSSKVKPASNDGKAFNTDFSDFAGWNRNFYKIKADGANWQVDEGVLKGTSISRSWNIATITNGLYDNVDISMKVRFAEYTKDNSSLFDISVGKEKIYAGNSDTGVMFGVYGSGYVRVYDSKEEVDVNGWDTYIANMDKWHTWNIRIRNKQVSFSIDGKELYAGKIDSLSKGYIALQSDYVNVEVDDLKINPLS